MSGQYVTLLGADDVARAGNTIQSAAESISRSVGYLEEALQRDRALRDEQLARAEALIGRVETALTAAVNFLEGEELTT